MRTVSLIECPHCGEDQIIPVGLEPETTAFYQGSSEMSWVWPHARIPCRRDWCGSSLARWQATCHNHPNRATQFDYPGWRTLCESGLPNKPMLVRRGNERGPCRKPRNFMLNIAKKGSYIHGCNHRLLTWHPVATSGWILEFSNVSLVLLPKSEDGFDLNEFGDLDSLEVVKYVTA
jgi:hypothetical protein